jgi:hypothetical protein
MRYFIVEQHKEPRSMYAGNRIVDIAELEKTAKEVTYEQAIRPAAWGDGHIEVDESGNWKFLRSNFDCSG